MLAITTENNLLTYPVPVWYNSGVRLTERIVMPVIENMFSQHPQVKGIFVGGCVDRGDGSSFRKIAHAHTQEKNHGWICVRSPKRLYMADGKPSQVMLHELAHILTNQGHTDKWRLKMKEIGGSIDYWYTREYNLCRRAGYRPRSLKEAKDCLRTIKRQDKVLA